MNSAPAKFVEGAHSEKAGGPLSNSERAATDRFPVDPDQVRHEAWAGEEFLNCIDQIFGRLEVIGETARDGFGEETRFGWFGQANRDSGWDLRKLLLRINFADQHV